MKPKASAVELWQRGQAPLTGWAPTWLPRFSYYTVMLLHDGESITPRFVRLSMRVGRREFWFYPWPIRLRRSRFGTRRLLTAAEQWVVDRLERELPVENRESEVTT